MQKLSTDLPPQVGKYLEYVSSLKFDAKPDYAYCKKLFKNLMIENGHTTDIYFDWLNKKMNKPINKRDYVGFVESKKNSP